MTDTGPSIPLQDVSQDVLHADSTNAERLRAHLPNGSLATALLTAWEAGDAAEAPSRMLTALEAFHAPKQTAEHGSSSK